MRRIARATCSRCTRASDTDGYVTRCKNCEAALDGPYCGQCGQRNIDLERPFSALLGETLRETFDVDGRVARTLRTLLLRPGVLTVEYVAGRRRRYSSPLRFYLVVSVLFFVVAGWIAGQGALLEDGQTMEGAAADQARLVGDLLPKLMFLLLPAFALILKATYRRRRYFDHLIHALHLHTSAYIALALMLPLEEAASDSVALLVVQFVLLAYLLVAFVMSLKRVYGTGWLPAIARALAIIVGYMILVAALLEFAGTFVLPDSASLRILSD